ncbi:MULTISPECIES: hypothetical protein [unclassified Lysinibacillus]|uniref:hypothetical protein n=1 Tax=unclassified Lysinibacillus TaxID=2636778 RepID=UPI0011505D75
MTYFGFKISREDEANFPKFKDYKEAREYFKKRYGDKYNLGYWEHIEGWGKVYFDDVDGQPVQIREDGNVHVVY